MLDIYCNFRFNWDIFEPSRIESNVRMDSKKGEWMANVFHTIAVELWIYNGLALGNFFFKMCARLSGTTTVFREVKYSYLRKTHTNTHILAICNALKHLESRLWMRCVRFHYRWSIKSVNWDFYESITPMKCVYIRCKIHHTQTYFLQINHGSRETCS